MNICTQENSDSCEPSSGDSLVTVAAAAVLPPSSTSPAPLPTKKFFKKSRVVEEVTKEESVEGVEDEAPSSRHRPRRPAQRTERMSPRPPVPRSPLQARSPLQVPFNSQFADQMMISKIKKITNDYFPGEVSPAGDEQPPPVSPISTASVQGWQRSTFKGGSETSGTQLPVTAVPTSFPAISRTLFRSI